MTGKSGSAAISPPGSLTAGAVAELRGALEAARGKDAAIDLSGVETIGGLCLELVLAAQATWRAEGRTLSLEAPSAAFMRDAATLGATQALGLETGGTEA